VQDKEKAQAVKRQRDMERRKREREEKEVPKNGRQSRVARAWLALTMGNMIQSPVTLEFVFPTECLLAVLRRASVLLGRNMKRLNVSPEAILS
jgi:hypothetical protein